MRAPPGQQQSFEVTPPASSARELFRVAVGLPREEQERYLDTHATDNALRRDVEALLAADADAETVLARLAQNAARDFIDDPPGFQLGPYRTVKLLGRGGMGAVYLADRTDGQVDQRVAIKVLQAGLAPSELVTRFQAERRILARLSHPNIAAFYDAGTTPDSRLWFAMEYVDGVPIDQFADAKQLGPIPRVRLFLQVLDAVEYAHRNVIIHRDLKPANILVGENGVPKLLDFGIARVLSDDNRSDATLILTPHFAAPEQVRGDAVTTATDTYLAGGVLYRLLTGKNPRDLASATPARAEKLICEEDPAPPRRLNPALDTDLENIVMMSLRREPERRYASAALFKHDLEMYLEGKPVSATADSLVYRMRRFIWRHRLPVAAALFCLTALIAGIAATAHEAAVAHRHFQEVRALANSFLFDFEKEIHDLPGATKARSMVTQTGQKYLDTLYAESPGDETLMRELALAYEKLAVVQGSGFQANTGEYSQAGRNFQRSIDLRLRLGDGRSTDPKIRRALVRLYATYGLALFGAGRISEAKSITLEGVRNGEEILRISQADDARFAAFNGYRTHATILSELGDVDGATDYFHRATQVVERWTAAEPENISAQWVLADLLYNQADTQNLFGDPAASADSARRASQVLHRLMAKKTAPQYARMEILLEGAYARALSYLGNEHARESDDHFQTALKLGQARVSKDPDNSLARSDLLLEQSLWGDALARRNDKRAVPLLLNAQAAVERAMQNAPEAAGLVQSIADIDLSLATAQLRSKPSEARAAAADSLRFSKSIVARSPDDSVSKKAAVEALIVESQAEKALHLTEQAHLHAALAQQQSGQLLSAAPSDKQSRDLHSRALQLQ